MDQLSLGSVSTILAIIGAPIMTLFGWVHVQISSLRTDMQKKVPYEMLSREVDSVKEVTVLRHEHICERLEGIEIKMAKIEAKLDQILNSKT